MHPDWARSLRDQCKTAEVPFFFKQWGEWTTEYPQGKNLANMLQSYQYSKTFYKVGKHNSENLLDGVKYEEYPKINL
jgi:protein gp37